jgi:PIN domain nuclease of toxin-antitoxin system
LKLLLDTHVWLWLALEPERLSRKATAAVEDATNEVFLSPISVWETLVLARRGRIDLEPDPQKWVGAALGRTPATVAELTHAVAMRSETLPGFRSRDPADRFLVATALVGDLALVTADRAMRRYRPLRTLW